MPSKKAMEIADGLEGWFHKNKRSVPFTTGDIIHLATLIDEGVSELRDEARTALDISKHRALHNALEGWEVE